jgi:hypothetical protein
MKTNQKKSNNHEQTKKLLMEKINLSLPKVKSSWELIYNVPIIFNKISWDLIIDNLITLFRKDTFYNLVGNEDFYPQKTPNCRYYIKPNDGSSGKKINIVNSLPPTPIPNCTICPEIMSPLIYIDNQGYKYDYRVWIGITSDLKYYICPTLILRLSNIPFDINNSLGSLTNTSLYSEQFNHQDNQLYIQIDKIVNNVLNKLEPKELSDSKIHLMLTGWDFIIDKSGKLFVLEVNCSPGLNILHKQVMEEYISWIFQLDN